MTKLNTTGIVMLVEIKFNDWRLQSDNLFK